MAIQCYENLSEDVRKLFKLDTRCTSYVMGVVDEEQFLGHVYYGERLNDYHLAHELRIQEGPFVPSRNNRDRGSFLDSFPLAGKRTVKALRSFVKMCLQDFRPPCFIPFLNRQM